MQASDTQTNSTKNKVVKVLDYIPATGKSNFIFEYMKANKGKHFLYVTPLLSEAESRAVESCAESEMETPYVGGKYKTKAESLLALLKEGKNISTTHSLFNDITNEHIKEIKYRGYVLIIDEVLDLVESYNRYARADIRDLYERKDITIDVNNKGKVSMTWEVSKDAYFEGLKKACDADLIYASVDNPDAVLTIHIPPAMIEAASEVLVCTYMYETSVMHKFLSMHGFSYEYLKPECLEQRQQLFKQVIKSNIEVITLKGFDKIAKSYPATALSHSWYNKAIDNGDALELIKVCSNWLRNSGSEYKNNFFFTTPKAMVEKRTPTGRIGKAPLDKKYVQYFADTTKSEVEDGVITSVPKWLSSQTKATNLYEKHNCCFYLMNIYPNIGVQQYLSNYGYGLDSDKHALSEMIQFVFRGSIRKRQPMLVVVPSERMRGLFLEWLNSL